MGTLITARRVFAGVNVALTGEVVEYESGHQATMVLHGGPLRSTRARYAVDSTSPTTCRVTYAGDVDTSGPLRLLSPIIPLLGRRDAAKNLSRLRRRIAAGIPPRSSEPTP